MGQCFMFARERDEGCDSHLPAQRGRERVTFEP